MLPLLTMPRHAIAAAAAYFARCRLPMLTLLIAAAAAVDMPRAVADAIAMLRYADIAEFTLRCCCCAMLRAVCRAACRPVRLFRRLFSATAVDAAGLMPLLRFHKMLIVAALLLTPARARNASTRLIARAHARQRA